MPILQNMTSDQYYIHNLLAFSYHGGVLRHKTKPDSPSHKHSLIHITSNLTKGWDLKNNGLNPWSFQFWGHPRLGPRPKLPPPPKTGGWIHQWALQPQLHTSGGASAPAVVRQTISDYKFVAMCQQRQRLKFTYKFIRQFSTYT